MLIEIEDIVEYNLTLALGCKEEFDVFSVTVICFFKFHFCWEVTCFIVKAHFSFAFSGLKHHLLESSVGYLNSNCTLPIFTKTGFY